MTDIKQEKMEDLDFDTATLGRSDSSLDRGGDGSRVNIPDWDPDIPPRMPGEAGGGLIDLVLVFKDTQNETVALGHEQRRQKFEDFLRNTHGITVHRQKAINNTGNVYVLLNVSFERLCSEAEFISLNMPIKKSLLSDTERHMADYFRAQSKISPKLRNHWSLRWLFSGVEDSPRDHLPHMDFYLHKFSSYEGSDNPATFFSPRHRMELAYSILSYSKWAADADDDERGIEGLLLAGLYESCYPLHDGPYDAKICERHTLGSNWAQQRLLFKRQPFERIRNYMGFYTLMLSIPSGVGLVCLIYGVAYALSDPVPISEFCYSDKMMCAYDPTHPKIPLKDQCAMAKLTAVFDNDLTVFAVVLLVLWGEFFVLMWRRRQKTQGFKWHLLDFEMDEMPRAGFVPDVIEENPATGRVEPTYTRWKYILKKSSSFSVLLFFVILVFATVFGIVLYRAAMQASLYSSLGAGHQYGPVFVSSSAAMINLVCILLLEIIYEKVAKALTDWENHRYQSEFDRSLTFKLFCFNFANFYSTLLYIAFFKGRFVGTPTNPTTLFGYPPEICSATGCMSELTIQLLIIMGGKQFFSNFVEIGLPWFKMKYNVKYSKLHSNTTETPGKIPQWEQDYALAEPGSLFFEYLEMVLQFGFLMLFGAAMPAAALLSILNNVAEIRIDATKYIRTWRRPIPYRAMDIGTWEKIIRGLKNFGIVSLGCILAFTSDFIPRTNYYYTHGGDMTGYIDSIYAYSAPTPEISDGSTVDCYYLAQYGESGSRDYELISVRLAFFIIFENIAIMFSSLLNLILPPSPRWLNHALHRESFEARKQMMTKFDKDEPNDRRSRRKSVVVRTTSDASITDRFSTIRSRRKSSRVAESRLEESTLDEEPSF